MATWPCSGWRLTERCGSWLRTGAQIRKGGTHQSRRLNPYVLNLRAALPFGADHIVMVRSAEPMPQLVGVLAALDGQKLSKDLMVGVLKLIGQSGAAIGIAGVYTQPAG